MASHPGGLGFYCDFCDTGVVLGINGRTYYKDPTGHGQVCRQCEPKLSVQTSAEEDRENYHLGFGPLADREIAIETTLQDRKDGKDIDRMYQRIAGRI